MEQEAASGTSGIDASAIRTRFDRYLNSAAVEQAMRDNPGLTDLSADSMPCLRRWLISSSKRSTPRRPPTQTAGSEKARSMRLGSCAIAATL